MEKVASAVEQSAFYSALWGSILTSPAVRLPGVTFVLLHLNRKLSMEDQLYVMGSDIELMVHAYGTLSYKYSFSNNRKEPYVQSANTVGPLTNFTLQELSSLFFLYDMSISCVLLILCPVLSF